jgi:hypothetical protein
MLGNDKRQTCRQTSVEFVQLINNVPYDFPSRGIKDLPDTGARTDRKPRDGAGPR